MKNNPFAVSLPPRKIEHDDLLCPVCGKDQRCPGQWRVCVNCDEKMTGWNDAPPEIMRAFTGIGVWPSPTAGRA